MDGILYKVVPAETVAELRLEVGAPATSEVLDFLETAASDVEALEAALRLLSFRARSRVELQRRLRRSGHALPAIDVAVARCDELGYLDDHAFALAYVRDRLKFRPRGRRVLAAELRVRGVDRTTAVSAIDEAFTEADVSEAELADRLARTRARSLVGLESAVARRRLAAYLARRGFSSATIREAVGQALKDAPTD
ncbi:MAG: regulatory protein RecX [Gemmatimonadota bacterium]